MMIFFIYMYRIFFKYLYIIHNEKVVLRYRSFFTYTKTKFFPSMDVAPVRFQNTKIIHIYHYLTFFSSTFYIRYDFAVNTCITEKSVRIHQQSGRTIILRYCKHIWHGSNWSKHLKKAPGWVTTADNWRVCCHFYYRDVLIYFLKLKHVRVLPVS